jgi:transcription termination factor NusB
MLKNAQYRESDPKYVAEEVSKIIRVIISKMSIESQNKAKINLKNRFLRLNSQEMSNKKTPAGASIGTSIALVKNILNGRDGYFIKSVIDELVRLL